MLVAVSVPLKLLLLGVLSGVSVPLKLLLLGVLSARPAAVQNELLQL